jgi:hypothetical protein
MYSTDDGNNNNKKKKKKKNFFNRNSFHRLGYNYFSTFLENELVA